MESDNGRREWRDMIAGWMEAPQQEVGKPLETGKGKKTAPGRPRETRKNPAKNLILAHWSWLQTSDLKSYKIITLCGF